MNPTDTTTVNQNELMTTLLKRIESLAQDHSNFKRITELNFNKVIEFTETSDRNQTKETRVHAKTMGMNHDTETDQPQDQHPLRN
jgi:predicted transcriptional regulator